MGLAASQARLLTITSRLSSVELRQQRIAMDKMRLANDSEAVSTKYTEALNNKTLTISNGGEEIAMNYSTLAAQGYSVMRASDGVIASSAGSSSAAGTSANSSANSSAKANANVSNPEIQKWVGQPAPTQPTFNEVAPTAPAKIKKPTEPTNINTTVTVPDFKLAISQAQNLSNTSYTYTHSWDGRNSEQQSSMFDKFVLNGTVKELIKSLYSQNLSKTALSLEEAMSKAEQTYKTAPKNLGVGNSGGYGKRDSAGFNSKIKTAENEYATTMLSALKTAQSSANSEAESIKQNNLTIQNNYNTELDKYNKNQQEWNTYNTKKAEYDSKRQAYQAQLSQYNIDYTNWVTANSSNGINETQNAGQATGLNSGSTAGTTEANATAAQELAAQLKNTQFLIQGLLSGYLVLVKDGQQVSLSSATSIIEEYDKSDDATAEAEYNTQMAKINRKEKQLDMQAKRIDTEYSALQQEYESVKSIISNHAKDFSYFS